VGSEGPDEFSRCDVCGTVIRSKIHFLSGWTHMSPVLQISEHSVGDVVVLLSAAAMLDTLRERFQIPSRLSQTFPLAAASECTQCGIQ
jgi:hypothetical protein